MIKSTRSKHEIRIIYLSSYQIASYSNKLKMFFFNFLATEKSVQQINGVIEGFLTASEMMCHVKKPFDEFLTKRFILDGFNYTFFARSEFRL